MKIPVQIERDNESCVNCMFLHFDYFDGKAECLLFKRGLSASIIHGQVAYWMPCSECNKVFHNINVKT